jgi:GNAT superfamily N-acetyltransferase
MPVDAQDFEVLYPLPALPSMSRPITIRPLLPEDWPATWEILEPVFKAGETFPHDPGIRTEQARRLWVEEAQATYGAFEAGGGILRTYYLKPNSLALGAHVANAGYVVAEAARGQGIGSLLCRHSQAEARRLGFRAMQFNLVVSTNEAGLRTWQGNGFRIVGTLPGAFRHRRLGYVDAHVMFQQLGGGRRRRPPEDSAEVRIQKAERSGHGRREAEDAAVPVAVEQRVVGLQQEGATPLGEEVVARHVGAPVAQHLAHVPQTHRGQLEGPLETSAAGPGEERTPDRRQGARLDGLVVGDALGSGSIARVAAQHLSQGAG